MDGHLHHHGFKPGQPAYRPGSKKLGELPAYPMDCRYQADQDGGAGHIADEQRDNRYNRGKPHSHTKEAPVNQIRVDIVPVMLVNF